MKRRKITLDEMADEAKDAIGIDITRLKPGTEITIQTQKSVYQMTIMNPFERIIEVVGGKHLKEPVTARFHGCTWGGSCIRPGWIGHLMYMEIGLGRGRVLTTTAVLSAKVSGEGWSYEMEWPSPTQLGHGKV